MSDARRVFQCSGTWVEVVRSGLAITVSYAPVIKRAGLRFEVYDFAGKLLDTYNIHDASPPTDMVQVVSFEAADAVHRTPWLAEHLQHGILELSESDEFATIPLKAVPGGLYELDGVRGVFVSDAAGEYLETATDELDLTEDEAAKLRPVSTGVSFVDAAEIT